MPDPDANAGASRLNHDRLKNSHDRACSYIRKWGRSGLWPYFPEHDAATEASAWCAIALRDEAEQSRAALAAMIEAANSDGGWSTERNMGHSDWTSGPALLCLRILAPKAPPTKEANKAIAKGLSYMFDSRTEFYGSIARLLLLTAKGKEGLQYARGWPWSPNCYHWIEPTTYALLALKIPTAPSQDVYSEVIERANQFMVEQECLGGGWNHGSHFCLGVNLPPYIVTTAEALLALQDMSELPAVAAGLRFLEKTEPLECSAMEHAFAILALHAHHRPADHLTRSLVDSQQADGSFGVNLMVTALSTLAIDSALSNRNPLKYSTEQKRSDLRSHSQASAPAKKG